jgi:endonuclease/exonuclease/phosphatase family metal-dependent hydrolase
MSTAGKLVNPRLAWPLLRLDYLFVPAPELPRVLSCNVVTGADVTRASDHLPIVADLRV